MKLSQLQKKYPKAFDKFRVTKDIKCRLHNINGVLLSWTLGHNVRMYWKEIIDFMDKQKIYVFIERHIYEDGGYCFRVVYTGYLRDETSSLIADCKTRKQAETKAIEESFRILEARCLNS